MNYQFEDSSIDAKFYVQSLDQVLSMSEARELRMVHIFLNLGSKQVSIDIDGSQLELPSKHFLTSTFMHQITLEEQTEDVVVLSFNKGFYCVQTHDDEISCNGIIFFGAPQLSPIALSDDDTNKFRLLLKVFEDEFKAEDHLQKEMLTLLLKRMVILCTRIAKQQQGIEQVRSEEAELIRKFHYLVDLHFYEKQTVADYADLLFKSPKTLSNIFSKVGGQSPSTIIQERIVLEARRLLLYTDDPVAHISDSLGYAEPASFTKMFKKVTGQTPLQFRKQEVLN